MDPSKIAEGIFLVLSNLAILPALLYSIQYKLIPELTILFIVFVISSFYHLCQTEFYCIIPDFKTHQTADHFFVFTALIWVILYAFAIPLKYRISLTFIFQALILLPLIFYVNLDWLSALFIGFIITILIFIFALITQQFPKFNIYNFLIVFILITVGLILHVIGGDTSSSFYSWTHSAWHIFSMLAIYFALDLRRGKIHHILKK